MFKLFLFLVTALQFQTFSHDGSFYLYLKSENREISFSTYRMHNPERIVLEIAGKDMTLPQLTPSGPVKSISRINGEENTRLVFYVDSNSFYNIQNRKEDLLIGFSSELIVDEMDMEKSIAMLRRENEKAAATPEESREDALVAELLSAKKEHDRKKEVESAGTDSEKIAAVNSSSISEKSPKAHREVLLEKERLAELERKQEEEKQLAEIEKRRAEEKRLAEIERKRAEEKRLAEIERRKAEEKRLAEIERRKAEEKRLAEIERRKAEEKRLAEIERKKAEEKRFAELEKRRAEEHRLAELERKRAEEKRLAELERKRAEEKRLAEIERKRAEEKRLAELERKRAEEKRLAEIERKRAEEKRLAELEKKRAEEKRLAEIKKKDEEKKRRKQLAERRLLEQEKRRKAEEERVTAMEKHRTERSSGDVEIAGNSKTRKLQKRKIVRSVKSPSSSEIKNLKVVKLSQTRKVSKSSPELRVVKLKKTGGLKNIYFRKFREFSRITMELTGDVEYRFREIKGGYVIDIFNLKRIPRHLTSIIDARAFRAEVKYVYPQKKKNLFKVYIKTEKGMAVRKTKDGDAVNFDFFRPETGALL